MYKNYALSYKTEVNGERRTGAGGIFLFRTGGILSEEVLFLHLVHKLEPEKWVFGSGEWTKHNIDF